MMINSSSYKINASGERLIEFIEMLGKSMYVVIK